MLILDSTEHGDVNVAGVWTIILHVSTSTTSFEVPLPMVSKVSPGVSELGFTSFALMKLETSYES